MKPTQTARRPAPREGQAMIEFALSFTLVLMLIFGIFELGRTIWSYTTVSYAARQAARYAIVRSDLGDPSITLSPDPIDQVVYKNAPGLSESLMTITKSWTPDNSRGSQFTITVEYPVNLIASELFLSGTDQIKVRSSSTYTILN